MTKILVLANSKKRGGRCVAGRKLTLRQDGTWTVGAWIRLTHPETKEGEIPVEMTWIDQHFVAPGEMLEVGPIRNTEKANHPEDGWIDPAVVWRRITTVSKQTLFSLRDEPAEWWDGATSEPRRVPEGYVAQMPSPSTLRFITGVSLASVYGFWEDRKDGRGPRQRVQLKIWQRAKGKAVDQTCRAHLFNVTDDAFLERHKVARMLAQQGCFQHHFTCPANVAFTLSLTQPYNGWHYKIAAAIMEMP